MIVKVLIVLWILICIAIGIPFGKNIYRRFHTYLRFDVDWNVMSKSQSNERKKIAVTVSNDSIHRVLIKEVGIYNKTMNRYYSFHKLIDESSPLPIWLEKNQQLQFVQYVADIPDDFRNQKQGLKIYAKDSQDRLYF